MGRQLAGVSGMLGEHHFAIDAAASERTARDIAQTTAAPRCRIGNEQGSLDQKRHVLRSVRLYCRGVGARLVSEPPAPAVQ